MYQEKMVAAIASLELANHRLAILEEQALREVREAKKSSRAGPAIGYEIYEVAQQLKDNFYYRNLTSQRAYHVAMAHLYATVALYEETCRFGDDS